MPSSTLPMLMLTIVDGATVTKYPDPFHAGYPGATFNITASNATGQTHSLRIHKFKDDSGNYVDPISGPQNWPKLGPGESEVGTNQVKNTTKVGKYAYVVELDGTDLADPEIYVDPPPRPHHRPTPKPKAAKKRAPAKRKSAKKKVATKKKAGKKKR
jgi:hypothetical protein